MSVYSGFATRSLETSYNKTVFAALYILQNAIVRSIQQQSQTILSERDTRNMGKAFNRMASLEKRKQLQPKFSKALFRIAELLDFNQYLPKVMQLSDEDGYSSIELPTAMISK